MRLQEGQSNAGGGQAGIDDSGKPYYHSAPRSDYPRMMYKQTDIEQTQESADSISDLKDAPTVINRFGAQRLLCDTIVAYDADEAETLTEMGWDTSPEAAYGLKVGLAAVTSAKDARIAELEAMLAAQTETEDLSVSEFSPEPRRRGRPPKEPIAQTF